MSGSSEERGGSVRIVALLFALLGIVCAIGIFVFDWSPAPAAVAVLLAGALGAVERSRKPSHE